MVAGMCLGKKSLRVVFPEHDSTQQEITEQDTVWLSGSLSLSCPSILGRSPLHGGLQGSNNLISGGTMQIACLHT